MNRNILAVAFIAAASLASPAVNATSYNATDVTIFGAGNPDGGWTKFTDSNNPDAYIALRGKNRVTGDTSNVNGVYAIQGGLATPTRGYEQIEFSYNSGSQFLNAYDLTLKIDTDPSAAVNYVTLDPLAFYNDNAYGDNSTPNGGGTVGLASLLAGLNSKVQNSENGVFVGHDPNVPGIYNIEATMRPKGVGNDAPFSIVADIEIDVGDVSNIPRDTGGNSVPDGGSTGLMFAGACVAGFIVKRKFAA